MYKNSEKLSPSCSSSEELVAYLYGEMSTEEQSVFEDHLAACDSCTAEFAEVSFARLGVYEWHRDDFAALETPRVVIPYNEIARRTWTETLKSLFASPVRIGAAAAFAAVVAAGSIFVFTGKPNETAETVKPAAAVTNKPEPVKEIARGKETKAEEPPARATDPHSDSPAPIRAAIREPETSRKRQPRAVKVPRTPAAALQAKRITRAPRLNDFEDEEDNTLRLGDLLADLETRD